MKNDNKIFINRDYLPRNNKKIKKIKTRDQFKLERPFYKHVKVIIIKEGARIKSSYQYIIGLLSINRIRYT
jgi:hypothetical protein